MPVQPRSYFDKLQSRIIDEGLGFIAITDKSEVPLSAAVFCTMNKTLLYKYGASDPEKMNLSPNYQMFLEVYSPRKIPRPLQSRYGQDFQRQ